MSVTALALVGTVIKVASAASIITSLALKIKRAADEGEDVITVDDEIRELLEAKMASSEDIIKEADRDMGKG